jgi:hypothetical protein
MDSEESGGAERLAFIVDLNEPLPKPDWMLQNPDGTRNGTRMDISAEAEMDLFRAAAGGAQ